MIGLTAPYKDVAFLAYLKEMGFVRFANFKLDDGTPVVELSIDAPFPSLLQPTLFKISELSPQTNHPYDRRGTLDSLAVHRFVPTA
jgi:hypothetical protein